MNKNSSIYKLYKKLKYEWGHLDFATKCIFFIGILLLFQLIYAIFVPANALDSTTQIVFRTSTSSIFGFILGMAHSYSTKKASPPSEESEDHEKQEFVFNKDINLNKATHVRILFSTTVCIICIIVFLFICFFLLFGCIQNSFLYIEFHTFDFDVPRCGLFCVYSTWVWLIFLILCIGVLSSN